MHPVNSSIIAFTNKCLGGTPGWNRDPSSTGSYGKTRLMQPHCEVTVNKHGLHIFFFFCPWHNLSVSPYLWLVSVWHHYFPVNTYKVTFKSDMWSVISGFLSEMTEDAALSNKVTNRGSLRFIHHIDGDWVPGNRFYFLERIRLCL